MTLGNKFIKHDGSWRVVGPCIDDGDCIGDYVEVTTSNGTKQVLITKIETLRTKHVWTKKETVTKMGVPTSKKEEEEYCGFYSDYEQDLQGFDYFGH